MSRVVALALVAVVAAGAGGVAGLAIGRWSADPGVDVDRVEARVDARAATTTSSAPATPSTAVEPPMESRDDQGIAILAVVDGDTVDATLDGDSHRIRLLGVNAPEDGECFAGEAERQLASLLSAASVIELGERFPERDRYGRLLTDLIVDGSSAAEHLVRTGHALSVAYGRSPEEQAPLDEAQQAAAAGGIGLWAADACGVQAEQGVQIVEVVFDAPGNDGENKNGEWVEIQAQQPTDLSGWVLKDESASHRFRFPEGTVVESGHSIRVFTGCGAATRTQLFWCVEGSAVWNNSGDTAFLLDPSGTIVHFWSY